MNNQTIKKNNFLEVRYHMTAVQKNIVYFLLEKLGEGYARNCTIHMADYQRFAGVTIDYKQFRAAVRGLASTELYIGHDQGVSKFKLVKVTGYNPYESSIELWLPLKGFQFLLLLKQNFTPWQLRAARALKSAHAKHIYEMVCQCKAPGTMRLSIKELKRRMRLEDKYESISVFRISVLDVVQQGITADTELVFSYELEKTGRKYTHVVFHIAPAQVKKNSLTHKVAAAILGGSVALLVKKYLLALRA